MRLIEFQESCTEKFTKHQESLSLSCRTSYSFIVCKEVKRKLRTVNGI